jgi:hypothetical protein
MTFGDPRRYLLQASIAAALPLFFLSAGSSAASVPAGAESRALGLDPIFRGGVPLVFLHPQQAVLQPRQLLALDTGGNSSGMGVILGAGGQRFCLFATRETLPAGTISEIHGGWARQVGALRLGLSAGGTLSKESSNIEQLDWSGTGTDYDYRLGAGNQSARSVEGLAGLGVGRGRRHLDLTWDSRWESTDLATAELRWTGSDAETTVVSLEGDRRPFQRYHLRAGWGLGSATDLLVMGQWGGRHERWNGSFRGVVFESNVLREETPQEWRDSWKAGAALSFPLGDVDRITASATWGSQKLPEYLVDPGSITHRSTSRRDGVLALSAEERVWRDLTLLAGLRGTYFRERVDAQRVDAPRLASAESHLSEGAGQEFTWGAAWTHGGYHLGAIVSTTLQLDHLLGSLDLGYRF